jgi:integrase
VAACRAFQDRNKETWKRARGLNGEMAEAEKWTEEETDWLYGKSMEWCAEIAGKSTAGDSEDVRRRIWDEYREFLGKNAYGVSVETAGAEDVLAFIRGFWIPRHLDSCRTVAANGAKVVATATVKQVLQHVSKSYDLIGQDRNNPAKSELVRAFKEGYRKMLHGLGVREKKAVVFKEGKVEDLIQSLRDKINAKRIGIERCRLIMDLAAVLYLWETWVRGKECGTLERRQVHEAEGVVLPGWSKTIQQEPSSRIVVETSEERLTFLEATAWLLKEMEIIGQPVGSGFLFRPLARDRKTFRSEAITSAALRGQIQNALKRAGLFEGETLHSFRRSAAQHAVDVLGYTVEKAMEKGRWKSFSAFQGYVEEVMDKLKPS